MSERVALITGASSGIGRATARAFAAKGARVVVAARREPELASLVAEIEAAGGHASAVVTDVSESRDVERMVAHAIVTYSRLDYAVNNAGVEGEFASITTLAEQEWDRVLGINLKGTFLCLQHEVRAMLATGHGGAIVNIGSVNSFLGFATGAAYVTSKHGLIGLTTCVSAEVASQGIRVNLVCPGIIDTPMQEKVLADVAAKRGLTVEELSTARNKTVPLGRAASADECAGAIWFLLSDEASYMTGQAINYTGGLVMW